MKITNSISIKVVTSNGCSYELFYQRICAIFCDGIPGFPNKIPDRIKGYFPKFVGNKSQSAKKHVQKFSNLIYDFDVCHEDLWMRLFVQTLEGYERYWFTCLPTASISSWAELSLSFIEQLDRWVDVKLMLDQLMEI